MKRIYDFSRNPAKRNYTVSDLKALKGSGKTLSMANPANNDEIVACVDFVGDLTLDAKVVSHHFFDPEGQRQNA